MNKYNNKKQTAQNAPRPVLLSNKPKKQKQAKSSGVNTRTQTNTRTNTQARAQANAQAKWWSPSQRTQEQAKWWSPASTTEACQNVKSYQNVQSYQNAQSYQDYDSYQVDSYQEENTEAPQFTAEGASFLLERLNANYPPPAETYEEFMAKNASLSLEEIKEIDAHHIERVMRSNFSDKFKAVIVEQTRKKHAALEGKRANDPMPGADVATWNELRTQIHAAPTTGVETWFQLTCGITIPTTSEYIEIKAGQNIVIHGCDTVFDGTNLNQYSMFMVRRDGQLTFHGVHFQHAQPTSQGAITVAEDGILVLENGCDFRHNTSIQMDSDYGVISLRYGGSVMASAAFFKENETRCIGSRQGGDVSMVSTSCHESIVETGSGGAVFANNLVASQSYFNINQCPEYGGGIYANSVDLYRVAVTSNEAGIDGGGVYFPNGTINSTNTLEDLTVSWNRCGRNGGGLYFQDAPSDIYINPTTCNWQTCEFNGNKCKGDGGAIYIPASSRTRLHTGSSTRFRSNMAGALYLAPPSEIATSLMYIEASEFTYNLGYGWNNADVSYRWSNHAPFMLTFDTNKMLIGGPSDANAMFLLIVTKTKNSVSSSDLIAIGQVVIPLDQQSFPVQWDMESFETALVPGHHKFFIQEYDGSSMGVGVGWGIDPTVHTIEFDTSIDTEDIPIITNIVTSSPMPFTFRNSKEVEYVPTAMKQVLGGEIPDGKFEVGLYKGSTLVTTGTADAEGHIVFDPAAIGIAGTYNYTMKEITSSDSDHTTDATVWPVTLTAVAGDDKLYPILSYPNGVPNFVNTKISDKEGLINFGEFDFTEPGTYEFTIEEVDNNTPDWTIDPTIYHVNVVVEDDGFGNLVAHVEYPDSYPVFTDYLRTATGVQFDAKKEVSGYGLNNNHPTLQADQFFVGIYEQPSDTFVGYGANADDGSFVFPELSFGRPGSYEYKLREINLDGNGWTVGGEIVTAVVTVTDDGQGNMSATVAYSPASPKFTNAYDAVPLEFTISANKYYQNISSVPAGKFQFELYDSTNTVVATGLNAAWTKP